MQKKLIEANREVVSLTGRLAAARAAVTEEEEKKSKHGAPARLLRKMALTARFGEALQRKQSEFLRGTRKWVFDKLNWWLRLNDSSQRLFWLKGSLRSSLKSRRIPESYLEH